MRLLLGLTVAASLLAGCSSGQSCDELPELQAERDALRQQHADKVGSGQSTAERGQADDELHELEQRVYELEQSCADR